MNLKKFFIKLRSEIINYSIGRSESSAFIIWFLENYFRLERQDAIDFVCDQKNDKGIDAIFVDNEEEKIYLIQSKFSPVNFQEQGDNDLRNFIGAKEWFKNEDSIKQLLKSTASKELKALVKSHRLLDKTDYEVICVFITNKKFTHAEEFIKMVDNFETWDYKNLLEKYTYFADNEVIFPPKDIYLQNKSSIEYDLVDSIKVKVYSVPAKELVKLEGIKDRTLFYKNVRYGVGKTRVNKSIKKSIITESEHSNFFLYHNGITIICEDLSESSDKKKITISNYAVINGCQSMLTLYENKNYLTKNLQILVKVIELNPDSLLVKDITFFANNQNSISIKDLRSNDSVQKSLQNEFSQLFGGKVKYVRKRGEHIEKGQELIDKDLAAQLITAFYLDKPHNTHLKQKLFGTEYANTFSRRINAEKIYLAYIIYKIIQGRSNLISIPMIRNYGLAIFFFVNVLKVILEEDNLGQKIINEPKEFVTNEKDILVDSIEKLWDLITPDINFDLDEYTRESGGYFDYKNVFKNGSFVEKMTSRVKNDYIRLTRRNKGDSFKEIYSKIKNKTSL